MESTVKFAFIKSLKSRPRLSAVLEMLLFVVVFLVFDYFSEHQNRYWDMTPHPFWFIIILIAIQYGANEGLVAVVLCTTALLSWNLPATSLNENIYDYLFRVCQRPMMWTVVTVIVGEMTSRLKIKIYELETQLDRVTKREESITKAYKNLKSIKEQMETSLVGQLRSSIDSFNAVRSIDSLNPVHLLKSIAQVIQSITGPDQLSVYIITNSGFELVDTHGWGDEMEYKRHFAADSQMFQKIASEHRVLCVINAADAGILEQEGVMAGPLIDPVNNMLFGMVKIERLDFMELTQTNVDTFKIMLEWAGATFTQARQYQKAYTNLMHNPKSGMLSSNFYKYYHAYLSRVSQAKGDKFYQLNILINEAHMVLPSQRVQVARGLVQFAKDSLERDLLLFTKKMNHSQFALILVSADPERMDLLRDQIKEYIKTQNQKGLSLSIEWETL